MQYDPSNWYWIVAGDTSKVWSSAAAAYLPADDAVFTAWVDAGGSPTRILNALELADVLAAQWQPLYLAAGVAVTSKATPALNATYSAAPSSLDNITSLSTGIAAGKPLPSGGTTFNYPDMAGAQHAFSASDFLNFAAAIEGLVYDIGQAIGASLSGTPTSVPALSVSIA